jgi:hypothetical protein
VKAKPQDGEGHNRENVTKVDCPFIVWREQEIEEG